MTDHDIDIARDLVGAALGYTPDHKLWDAPEIEFDLAAELENLSAETIGKEDEKRAAAQVVEAFNWCVERFALSVRDLNGRERCAIGKVCIARSVHEGEYITASSPHRPNVVFVAAPWPISSGYRLASLFVHEAMHQALYLRECRESPVRSRSLAYSPWKEQLRPGRLVWHSFWTFSIQYAFLAAAVVKAPGRLLSDDPNLVDFLADMDVRTAYCAQSLSDFDILLHESEKAKIPQALAAIEDLGAKLERETLGYHSRRRHFAAVVSDEVDRWSACQIAQGTAAEERAPAPPLS